VHTDFLKYSKEIYYAFNQGLSSLKKFKNSLSIWLSKTLMVLFADKYMNFSKYVSSEYVSSVRILKTFAKSLKININKKWIRLEWNLIK